MYIKKSKFFSIILKYEGVGFYKVETTESISIDLRADYLIIGESLVSEYIDYSWINENTICSCYAENDINYLSFVSFIYMEIHNASF